MPLSKKYLIRFIDAWSPVGKEEISQEIDSSPVVFDNGERTAENITDDNEEYNENDE